MNETAKQPAFSSILPEANHNELEGYQRAIGRFALILLSDPDDHPMISRRFHKMVEAIKTHSEAEFFSHVYQPSGQSYLERVFSALMWSHYLAYHLAVASDMKPEPVELIEAFKRELYLIPTD